MKRMMFCIVILCFLAANAEAAYKVYLSSGFSLSGVTSFEERGGQVILHFSGGEMKVSKTDIRKIVESGASDDVSSPEDAAESEMQADVNTSGEEQSQTTTSTVNEGTERAEQINVFKGQLNVLQDDIRALETQEAQLVTEINTKSEKRTTYWNNYQIRQLENELAPLRQNLVEIQKKKLELLDKRNGLVKQIEELRTNNP